MRNPLGLSTPMPENFVPFYPELPRIPSRSVHVANLHHNSVRYNLGIDGSLDFDKNAEIESVVNHWKERWLLPYLHRDEKALKKSIKRLHKTDLSSAYPPFDGEVKP